MNRINGFITAPFTPMKDNGSLNLPKIKEYAELVIRNGMDGVFVCGSSGEGALLTNEERISVAEEWMNVAGDRLKVIVHTGGTNLIYQQKLARHAQDIGAFAISSMAPAFLPPNRNDELVAYCKIIARSAPELPFYYYHIPSLNYFKPSVIDLLESADIEIPNFAGVKYTHDNMMEYHQCLQVAEGKFEMLYGRDESLLGALSFGAKSGVGGTYNHCFGLYRDLVKSFEKNDLERCRDLQHKSHLFIDILIEYRGNIICGKRIMKFLGLDCGPNRLPLQTISDDEERVIKNKLDEIEFFNFCNK
ncbi:dihydrodipicolinate synthase family protein [Bacteroidota bacterium]